jgi:branched-subunit amino acid ABC-type transport system permease component
VPINTIAAMTFAIGSALAAAAGILFGLAYPVLDPYMGVSFGWKAFVAAILGGRGSIMGACIAGFMLGFIEIMTVPAIQIVNRLFAQYRFQSAGPHRLFHCTVDSYFQAPRAFRATIQRKTEALIPASMRRAETRKS